MKGAFSSVLDRLSPTGNALDTALANKASVVLRVLAGRYDAGMNQTSSKYSGTRITTILLLTALLFGDLAFSRQSAATREFALPGHGTLHLSIPQTWKVEFESIKKPQAINLKITPSDAKTFNLQIEVLPILQTENQPR
jgi:hypothetical protein